MPFPGPEEYNPVTPLPQAKPGSAYDWQAHTAPTEQELLGIIGNYDRSRFRYEPATGIMTDLSSGGTYDYSWNSLGGNPALGTDVYTPANRIGGSGQTSGVEHFEPGQNPFFGSSGGNMFISADPNEIDRWQHNQQTRNLQGIAKVGALVGGGAALGGLGGGQTGSATVSGSNAAAGAANNLTGITLPSSATPISASAALPGFVGGTGTGAAAVGTGAAGAGSALGMGGAGAAGAGSMASVPTWLQNYLLPGVNSLLGYQAADNASDAQVGAMDRAIAEQARQYDQTRTDLQPWLTAGTGALGKLNDPNANFLQSPDYAFRRSEGQRDIGNSFAARGMGQSGNALKALTEYNSQLASGEFGDWWNRQAGLAGVGQTTATSLGQFGANRAANTGNYLGAQGDARASGVLGKYGAIGSGLNDSLYNYMYRRP